VAGILGSLAGRNGRFVSLPCKGYASGLHTAIVLLCDQLPMLETRLAGPGPAGPTPDVASATLAPADA